MTKHSEIRSNTQRLICLENAFKTVDAFIIPSASPDILEKYEEVKQYLTEMYQDGVPVKETEKYKF